jgi:hypothetical protein
VKKIDKKGGVIMDLFEVIDAAVAEVAQARANYEMASPEYVDVAIYKMAAAEIELNNLYRKAEAEGYCIALKVA